MFQPSQQLVERERAILAPFAMHSAMSQGRRFAESLPTNRSPWEIDRERLIRSAAYRRLSHKMQVFTGVMGDYHRTRLTHTLEVAVVARAIGRALRLNEDFVEALALVHDLGHPPFGHAGEAVLDQCLRDFGGFCHNRHALRVVEELERSGFAFAGLNLTIEVLTGQQARIDKRQPAWLEVQVVDAADSIAYDTHDTDDALKLGLLELPELCEIPLWRHARERVERTHTNVDADQLRRAILQELTDWQIADVIDETTRRLQATAIESPCQALAAGPLVRPTSELAELKRELEIFLYDRVYRHPRVLAMRRDAEMIVERIFDYYARHPEQMPANFFARVAAAGAARCAGDYLAGMTDRFAEERYRQIVGSPRRLRISSPAPRSRLTG
jgi:dGTPase